MDVFVLFFCINTMLQSPCQSCCNPGCELTVSDSLRVAVRHVELMHEL